MNRLRVYENMHIVLWLIKDTCWLTHQVTAGTLMIFPTLFVAIWLTWKTRNKLNLFLPNLAVTCWISANITWMTGEFYSFNFLFPALFFFILGMICMAVYFYMINISRKPNTNGS